MTTNHTIHQKPLVSFIVTYYNLPVDMLCQCIDSILKLSLLPFEREIIIVDDGSTQSPKDDLLHYGNEIVYVRQKNGGVSVARNTGLNMANGRYIQIIDADDYLIPSLYEHCLDIIRNNDDADVVMFDFTNNAVHTTKTYGLPQRKTGTELLCSENIRGAVWCCLFREAIRGHIQFTAGIAYGEDEEFTPQLLIRAKNVYTTKVQAYYYRKRNTSATHQIDDASITKRLNDTKEVIYHLNRLASTSPQNKKQGIQRRVAQLTMDYIYNTIMLTRSVPITRQCIKALRNDGLFPLPDCNYTKKYQWFRRLTNSRLGLSILVKVLPLMKKER